MLFLKEDTLLLLRSLVSYNRIFKYVFLDNLPASTSSDKKLEVNF